MFVASPALLARTLVLVGILAVAATLLWTSTFGAGSNAHRVDVGQSIAGTLTALTLTAWWLGVVLETLRTPRQGTERRERQLGSRERLLAALSVAPARAGRGWLLHAAAVLWATLLAGLGLWGSVQLLRHDAVPGVLALAAMVALANGAQFLLSGAGRQGHAPWIAQLGLALAPTGPTAASAITSLDATRPGGAEPALLLGGARPAGQVAIAGDRAHVVTRLEAPCAGSADLEEEGGRLVAGDGADPAIARAAHRLNGSRRWRGVRRVECRPDGITVTRSLWNRTRSPWVFDIWLAEYLLQEAERPGGDE